jgi:hypothetical protein
MPSTSKSELIATILRTVLPQQVPGAEVLPPSTWAEFGLSASGVKPLPDIVAYRSELKTLFIIQVVHGTDAPSAARHSALLRWSSSYQGPRVFVWAYASRTAYAANMGEPLADTYVWFADEPDHHLFISGLPEASAEFMSERFAARTRSVH